MYLFGCTFISSIDSSDMTECALLLISMMYLVQRAAFNEMVVSTPLPRVTPWVGISLYKMKNTKLRVQCCA